MSKIIYQNIKFRAASHELIKQCDTILKRYHGQGYDMTLRQLYYQLVTQNIIPNKEESYDNLGKLVSKARLAGLLDWNHLVDRTRNLQSISTWKNPSAILDTAAQAFRIDKWAKQPVRIEVWIEKEALAGVFARVCEEMFIPYFACKGYNSQSEAWRASLRMRQYLKAGQQPVILHFGDHDPSGLDMTRDITDRMQVFMADVRVERMALNMAQVEAYNPPPNPTKLTDSRAHGENGYIALHGHESWELDALPPDVLNDLVRTEVEKLRDDDQWQEDVDTENEHRATLRAISNNFGDVHQYTIDQGWIDEETEAGEGSEEDK